jgi:5-methylcytosine-specific restriction protein A
MSGSYFRDNKVRQAVLARANGRCEYGTVQPKGQQCLTFEKPDGSQYLETHHVIKLSEKGRDKESNVIALCANHHKEAHFGKNWKQLQDDFLAIVAEKIGS